MSDYAEHWQRLITHTVKPRTLARYMEILRLHVLPQFGKVRVRDMDRGRIKLFLTNKLATGLRPRTVHHIQAVLQTMLNAAIEDGVIASNPAARFGRALKLNLSRAATQEKIKAMTHSQRHLFLTTALRVAPRYHPVFFALAGTGMRLGEALALQPADADYSGKTIRILRAFSEDGSLETPKSGHGRTVDLSDDLVAALRAHDRTRKLDALRYGWAAVPPWMFVTRAGTPFNPANVRRAMLRVLKAAGLPQHFTPHCLRHTYASLLLADGISPVYVQEQLGHATIELTVSTYGRWLKKRAPGALNRLDRAANVESGSKVVADAMFAGSLRGTLGGMFTYNQALILEPASGIEPPTCGLRIPMNPPSLLNFPIPSLQTTAN
jgi:integrase